VGEMKKKLTVFAVMLSYIFLFANTVLAGTDKVNDLLTKIERSFFNNTLYEGKWELVIAVSESIYTEKVYKAPGQVIWIYEVYDEKTKKLNLTGVKHYATKNFGNLLQGLKPGMSEEEMDRFFGNLSSIDRNYRFYPRPDDEQNTGEGLSNYVSFAFKNGKADLLETSWYPDVENGVSNDNFIKVYSKFVELRDLL
jgi:hypothetical protein